MSIEQPTPGSDLDLEPAGTVELPSTIDRPIDIAVEAVGDVIGPYRLMQRLGEGGMGTVWVAEQDRPVKRRVALKLIKRGMDSERIVHRFAAERQALALMDHANIAKVLDAGAAADGRPYFAMELVKGVPITKYCDELHLSIGERLGLFVQVCSAVHHAHQKGVIHRDLKPSNILVAMQEGVPMPKVIDFGVAKALHSKLADRTMYTEIGQVIGTLEYMAPEQAELSALDIDTRADVYALGVLLYELLVGSTPLTRQRVKQAAFAEVVRLIKEEDPPKPSTRLSQSAQERAAVAAQRRSDPNRLAAELRGELDWIVLKALEKDRTRRYESASGFARDVQRYLANEPIEARPASSLYRFRKFARRRRGTVVAGAALLFALLLGFAGTSWGLVQANRQKARAEQAASAAREKEAETRAVLSFFEDRVLAAARPKGQDGGLGVDVTVKSALLSALPHVGKDFKDRPLVEATISNTAGQTLWMTGDAKAAVAFLERARDLRTKQLGVDHADTLTSMHALGNGYDALGRHADALALREETLRRRKAKLGPEHADTLSAMNNLANSLDALGRQEEALNLREETLRLRKASLGVDHLDTLISMNNLANSYDAMRRFTDALALREETLRLQTATLGADHPDTLITLNNLANSYANVNRNAEALKLYEDALRLRKAKLGLDHPDTLIGMNQLANCYADLGRQLEALKLREEALKLQKSKLGVDHPDTLVSMNNLSVSYYQLGRRSEAIKLREELLRLQKAKLGEGHPITLASINNLAASYADLGRKTESIKLREEAVELFGKHLGADHPDTLTAMHNLAIGYDQMGRHVEALKLREGLLAMTMARVGEKHPSALLTRYNIACAHALLFQKANVATEKENHLRLAVDNLERAKAGGYFSDPKIVDWLKKDPDFDGIRPRAEFQRFVSTLTTH